MRLGVLSPLRCGLLVVLLAAREGAAKPPVLTYLYPAGGQVGTSFDIKLEGSPDGPGSGVWVDCPGVTVLPAGKDKGRVIISDQAAPGLYALRTYNGEGVSAMRWFSIGTLPEVSEVEPNDAIAGGQPIGESAVCINGRLEKSGDVDGFVCKVEAGRTLVAAVEAYALGSPLDAVLNVYDEQGVRIATAHDGRNLDPVLACKVERTGRYTVQVSGFTHPPAADVRFTGGAGAIYRLQITTGPAVTHAFPPVVTLGAKSRLELRGYNLTAKDRTFEVDGTRLPVDQVVDAITVPHALWPVQVVPSSVAPTIEREPNNQAKEAQAVTMPCSAAGTVSSAGDVDRFAFTARKGERVSVRVRSKALGLPLDAMLKIESADGKTLASSDDQGELPDPFAAFNAPADGAYQAVVSDLFNRGGDTHSYVLEVTTEKPDFEVDLAGPNTLLLEAGKTVDITAKIKRIGSMNQPLVATVAGLPQGVLCEPVLVGEKATDVKLTLAAAIAAPGASQPVSLSVFAKEARPMLHRTARFALRGEEKRGTTLCDESTRIWLTVLPARAEPGKPASAAPATPQAAK